MSVKDGDVKTARDLANELANNEELYNLYSSNAKKNFKKYYSEEVFIDKVNKILNEG